MADKSIVDLTDDQLSRRIRVTISAYNALIAEASERGIHVRADAAETDSRLLLGSISKEI